MRGNTHPMLRVLVVDDNADTAECLAFLFRSWGHEVAVAHDGPGAIEAAAEFRPQAALVDIGLPGLDGFEVAQRLRRLPGGGRMLIVASTGFGRDGDRRRAGEAGIDLYLVKPFDPFELEPILAARCSAVEAIPA